jgi:putative Mg2+ transporter-C (MgtC) family protein
MISSATWEMFSRLLLALACGAVIGLNRDLHRKAAGVRTFSLVSVGAAVAALLMTQTSADADAVSRVVQGVLTGIGFLGAGVILHQPASSHVTGLTTAAAVWLTAALGLACGLGRFALAVAGLAIALLVIAAGKSVERHCEKLFWSKDEREAGAAADPRDADG